MKSKKPDSTQRRRQNIVGLLSEMDEGKLALLQNILVTSLMLHEACQEMKANEKGNRELMN